MPLKSARETANPDSSSNQSATQSGRFIPFPKEIPMNVKTTSSLTLAAAAAAMFALAPVAVSAADEVKCVGGNACKGNSACKTATSECKGLNACKGQGFVMAADEAACMEAGGTVEAS